MRRDLALVGGALVVAGAAVSFVPGLDPGVSGVGTPRVVAALAALAAATGVVVILRFEPSEPHATVDAASGTTGSDADLPTVGAGFDAALAEVAGMSVTRLRRSDVPASLRDRLRRAAVVTVARERGVDEDRAAALVAQGRWTDDPVAAAFLSSSIAAPPVVRLREALSTTPRVVARARRTAAELEGRP